MSLGFILVSGPRNTIFILEQLRRNAYSKLSYMEVSRPVKEEDKTRLQRNDTRIIRWMSNLRPEDKISIKELMTKLKLKSMGKCLQERKLPCFDHLERKKVLGFINVEPSVISQRAIWENME